MAARTGGLQLPSPLPARPRTRGALPLFLARNWALLTLVAIVALGAGLRVHQAATPGRYLSADERSYARIAMSLADQGTYAADGLARASGGLGDGHPRLVRRQGDPVREVEPV